MFLIAVPAIAQETAQDETVDVKGIIFGHLKDSYHWHIITIGDKEISLHLPVILYSKVTGWHFFSSRELEHTGSYDGRHSRASRFEGFFPPYWGGPGWGSYWGGPGWGS